MRSARFIAVEGIDGAGKDTQICRIQALLESLGIEPVVTREPGGTPLAEQIRSLLLAHRQEGMGEDAELLLMLAARAEHLRQVIRPALDRGDWVLSHRFTDSSYAYQGGGRGMDAERIAILENWVQGSLRPDLTIILDLAVDTALDRVGRRGAADRFEAEARDFFQRVREAFLARAAAAPARYLVVDADGEEATVWVRLEAGLRARLGL